MLRVEGGTLSVAVVQGKRISKSIDTVVLGLTQNTNKFKITTLSQGLGLTFSSLCE
jgi:hypothetical protein